MAKLLIIYYSQAGNTEAMANAVCEGASSAGAAATMKKAADTTGDDLLGCDAVAFGTPNYFSYMAGMIKDLLDRVWYTIVGKVENKSYALFTSAGGDNKSALERLDGLCKYLKLEKAFDDVVAKGKPSSEVLEECKKMGSKLAKL